MKELGVHQAIASSVSQANIDVLVDELEIRDFFKVLVTEYDISGKPNSDVFLRAESLMQAVDVLFERPILNIRQLEAAMEVPYRSAQRYVEKLGQMGVVREMTGRARSRLYQADEILSALEGPIES